MYQILNNNNNDLALIIDAQDTEPDGPMLICDGGDTALLFRDWGSNLRLRDISPETADELLNAPSILVKEVCGNNIVREYAARIRKVKNVKSMMMP